MTVTIVRPSALARITTVPRMTTTTSREAASSLILHMEVVSLEASPAMEMVARRSQEEEVARAQEAGAAGALAAAMEASKAVATAVVEAAEDAADVEDAVAMVSPPTLLPSLPLERTVAFPPELWRCAWTSHTRPSSPSVSTSAS